MALKVKRRALPIKLLETFQKDVRKESKKFFKLAADLLVKNLIEGARRDAGLVRKSGTQALEILMKAAKERSFEEFSNLLKGERTETEQIETKRLHNFKRGVEKWSWQLHSDLVQKGLKGEGALKYLREDPARIRLDSLYNAQLVLVSGLSEKDGVDRPVLKKAWGELEADEELSEWAVDPHRFWEEAQQEDSNLFKAWSESARAAAAESRRSKSTGTTPEEKTEGEAVVEGRVKFTVSSNGADAKVVLKEWQDASKDLYKKVAESKISDKARQSINDRLKTQGLIMSLMEVHVGEVRSLKDEQGRVQSLLARSLSTDYVYIDLVCTAPWNIVPNHPDKVPGAGTAAIAAAVQSQLESRGNAAVKLFAVKSARPFYEKIGMETKGGGDYTFSDKQGRAFYDAHANRLKKSVMTDFDWDEIDRLEEEAGPLLALSPELAKELEELEKKGTDLKKAEEGVVYQQEDIPVSSVAEMLQYAHADADYSKAFEASALRGDIKQDVWSNLEDQGYSPLAKELNDRVAARLLNPLAQVEKTATPMARIILGKPGSGKSSFGYASVLEEVLIDPDQIALFLPAYHQNYAANFLNWAADIATLLLYRSVSGRYNLCIDMQGREPKTIESVGKILKDLNYRLEVVFVEVSMLECLKRVYRRFKGGGRFVDLAEVVSAFGKKSGPRDAYNRLKKIADRWLMVSGEHEEKEVLEDGTR